MGGGPPSHLRLAELRTQRQELLLVGLRGWTTDEWGGAGAGETHGHTQEKRAEGLGGATCSSGDVSAESRFCAWRKAAAALRERQRHAGGRGVRTRLLARAEGGKLVALAIVPRRVAPGLERERGHLVRQHERRQRERADGAGDQQEGDPPRRDAEDAPLLGREVGLEALLRRGEARVREWACVGIRWHAWACMGVRGRAWACVGVHGHA